MFSIRWSLACRLIIILFLWFNYRPAFYLYAVLKIASGVLMLSIDLKFKQPAQNLLEDVIHVFKSVEIVALFVACFVMGKFIEGAGLHLPHHLHHLVTIRCAIKLRLISSPFCLFFFVFLVF